MTWGSMQQEIIITESEHRLVPLLWTGSETAMTYDIHLAGTGAQVTLLGLLLGDQSSEVLIKTNVFHEAKETRSEVIIRGALTDAAKVNYEGLVKIEPGAKGTNAWLAAHLLLLSDQAKGRAVPSLEILENDIKAGHATTVGRVNDVEMFYLMSRGLSRTKAKSLIIEGFLSSLLHRFPTELQAKATKELANYVKQ